MDIALQVLILELKELVLLGMYKCTRTCVYVCARVYVRVHVRVHVRIHMNLQCECNMNIVCVLAFSCVVYRRVEVCILYVVIS